MVNRTPDLTAAQQVLMQNVKDADAALRQLARSIDEEQRLEKASRLADQRRALDIAISRAVDGDDGSGPDKAKAISKRRVTQEGLGLKNPHAVPQALKRVSGVPVEIEPGLVHFAPGFEWLEHGRKLAIRIRNFPTQNPDPNYPEVLAGVLVLATVGDFSSWEVELDASDRETQFGLVPGFLRWEIERPRDGKSPHILDTVDEWVTANV